jgi:hypothetical protein
MGITVRFNLMQCLELMPPPVPSTPIPYCFFWFSAPLVLLLDIFITSDVDLSVFCSAKYPLFTVIVFDQ